MSRFHRGAGEMNPLDDFDFDACVDTGVAVFKDVEHLDEGIALGWADLICYLARNIKPLLESLKATEIDWWVEHDHQKQRLFLVAEWLRPGEQLKSQVGYVWLEKDATAPDHMRALASKGVTFVENAIRRHNAEN